MADQSADSPPGDDPGTRDDARGTAPDFADGISVVIAAHDAAATLPEQLDALSAQIVAVPWEIVVVDNRSTDDTIAMLAAGAARWPRVRVVTAPDGQGPSYARNVGAAEARGERLAFCDADDVVAPGWLQAFVTTLGPERFAGGPLDYSALNPEWLARLRGSTGATGVAVFESRFPFASSCNMAVDRALFESVGGFDEQLHVGEDIDLSMRLHLRGVELAFVAPAVVHYRLRGSLRELFRQAVAYGAARPVLAERWRSRGGIPISRWRGARNWAWLVRHLGRLCHRESRGEWVWVAGQRVGSLRGSARVRRLYP